MTTSTAYILSLNPSHFYEMQETSGTTCADSSGNGNDATYDPAMLLGQPSIVESDPTDLSVTMDGNQAIPITESTPSISEIDDFTFGFSYRLTTTDSQSRTLCNITDFSIFRYLIVQITNVTSTSYRIRILIYSSSGSWGVYTGFIAATIPGIAHVTVSRSKVDPETNTNRRYTVYVNGDRVYYATSGYAAGNSVIVFDNPVQMQIGGSNSGSSSYADKVIGDVSRVFYIPRELTTLEHITNYSKVLATADLTTSLLSKNPFVYYKMDDTSGTVLTDHAGGRDLQVTGDIAFNQPSLVPSQSGTSIVCAGVSGLAVTEANIINIDDFTFACTYKPNTLDNVTLLQVVNIDDGTPSTTQARVYFQFYANISTLRFSTRPTDGSSLSSKQSATYSDGITVGETYHILITRLSGTVSYYINGLRLSAITYGNTIQFTTNNKLTVASGMFVTSGYSERPVGFVDEVFFSLSGVSSEDALRIYFSHLYPAVPTPTVTITGDIDEGLEAVEFIVRSYNLETSELTAETLTATNNFTLTYDPSEQGKPQKVVAYAKIGVPWTPATPVALGEFIYPSDPTVTPHYFTCTVAGNTGANEPNWNVSKGATTTDGQVTWTTVEGLPRPVTHLPLIPH